jgi:hypothetical protein
MKEIRAAGQAFQNSAFFLFPSPSVMPHCSAAKRASISDLYGVV